MKNTTISRSEHSKSGSEASDPDSSSSIADSTTFSDDYFEAQLLGFEKIATYRIVSRKGGRRADPCEVNSQEHIAIGKTERVNDKWPADAEYIRIFRYKSYQAVFSCVINQSHNPQRAHPSQDCIHGLRLQVPEYPEEMQVSDITMELRKLSHTTEDHSPIILDASQVPFIMWHLDFGNHYCPIMGNAKLKWYLGMGMEEAEARDRRA